MSLTLWHRCQIFPYRRNLLWRGSDNYIWESYTSHGAQRNRAPGGGGGGALGYLGGCIRSLSKLKNTPKALISGQKSTLTLIKR